MLPIGCAKEMVLLKRLMKGDEVVQNQSKEAELVSQAQAGANNNISRGGQAIGSAKKDELMLWR